MDQLSKLLQVMVKNGASDLFLSPDRPPAFRIYGKLAPPEGSPLTTDKIEQMARLIMLEDQHQEFLENPDINIGLTLPNVGRFRVNIFRQRRATAMVIRAIRDQIPSMEELGLPDCLKKIVMLHSGLVLVAGPAGTGKSTSLAAMIEYRARHELSHIITLEDPIEYLFQHDQSIINQREVGTDTLSYGHGMVNVLRQSPDVLMVGEIRERGVLEKIMEFSETGHLSLATIHANSVTQAVERMIMMFPENERERALMSLAQNLRAVIAQRLVPSADGKQALAYETHTFTSHTADLIRRNETTKIYEFIQKDTTGMSQTLDQSLFKLYKKDKISPEQAIKHAASAGNMRLQMRLDGDVSSAKSAAKE